MQKELSLNSQAFPVVYIEFESADGGRKFQTLGFCEDYTVQKELIELSMEELYRKQISSYKNEHHGSLTSVGL